MTSECNYKSNTTLSCSAAAAGGITTRGAYCLNNNNLTKCGAQNIFIPDTFRRSLGTIGIGTLRTGTSDSCMWTIQGNNTDFKGAISLLVNTMVALNVSIFTGPTFESARLIASNIVATYRVNLTLLNNTYIVASPYSNTLTTTTFNLTYFKIPDVYNFTYIESLGYMYTVKSNSTTSESTFKNYLGIGIGFGFGIVFILIFFMLGSYLIKYIQARK